MTAADPRDGLREPNARLMGLCERLATQAKEYDDSELWSIRAELMAVAHARPEAVDGWPDYVMLRDTNLYDDAGGLGQRIFTTAGAGYKKVKYIRADLAALTPERAP